MIGVGNYEKLFAGHINTQNLELPIFCHGLRYSHEEVEKSIDLSEKQRRIYERLAKFLQIDEAMFN